MNMLCYKISLFVVLLGSTRALPTIFSWHAGIKFRLSLVCLLSCILLFINLFVLYQTVAVIPVLPHGVVQLGSFFAVSFSFP